ncbi:MAG TPA: hypothetical protein VG929_08545 [Actinomycetota bacterium]|nr:hypothetical protein [Actinomycetota bacterium]
MRKLVALSAAAVMVAAAFGGTAAAGKKKAAHQHVEGSIAIPQGTQGATGCVYRTHRALYIAMGEAVNGIFGYTFQVDPKTVGKPFKIEVEDGAGVDISFYGELGNDPTADAPANMGYEEPGPGGEKGTVPEGLPNVLVCLTDGAGADFVYTAGTGVK